MISLPAPLPGRWTAWLQRLADRWVHFFEMQHRRRSEGIPSPEAVDEAIAYYSGLYRGKHPDPAAFQRLLRRRGVPDWPNPYPISDPGYFDLHPDGFLWADMQCLAHSIVPPAVEDQWPQWQDDLAGAQLCWMMVLAETAGKWPASLLEIHPDNLAAITMGALLHPSLPDWDILPSRWKNFDILA